MIKVYGEKGLIGLLQGSENQICAKLNTHDIIICTDTLTSQIPDLLNASTTSIGIIKVTLYYKSPRCVEIQALDYGK